VTLNCSTISFVLLAMADPATGIINGIRNAYRGARIREITTSPCAAVNSITHQTQSVNTHRGVARNSSAREVSGFRSATQLTTANSHAHVQFTTACRRRVKTGR
jgi:hypothetical protein